LMAREEIRRERRIARQRVVAGIRRQFAVQVGVIPKQLVSTIHDDFSR
jgi:hypothetical protein